MPHHCHFLWLYPAGDARCCHADRAILELSDPGLLKLNLQLPRLSGAPGRPSEKRQETWPPRRWTVLIQQSVPSGEWSGYPCRYYRRWNEAHPFPTAWRMTCGNWDLWWGLGCCLVCHTDSNWLTKQNERSNPKPLQGVSISFSYCCRDFDYFCFLHSWQCCSYPGRKCCCYAGIMVAMGKICYGRYIVSSRFLLLCLHSWAGKYGDLDR